MIKTTATDKIFTLRKRIRGISGGTSASKTISILLWLIQRCQQNDNELWSVVSETFPHLKRGAMRDFLSILEEHKYFKPERWNKTDSIYTFETGSKLEFFSVDQPGKVRGPRRTGIFINEANRINYETYVQLEVRTQKIVWLDWNPVARFWFNEEVERQDNVDFITLTYLDNEGLSKDMVQAIEAHRTNKAWWRVYGEGQIGEVEGRIYTDWQKIDEIPHEARLERRGLDFGYSNDPSALVDVYYYNGGYILDEQIYQKGMSNKQIADTVQNLKSPQTVIVADSAEPKSIDELKSYGLNVLPVVKGKDSVVQGIQFVQSQRISYTKRSTNLDNEYNKYLWEEDNDGKIINEPSPIWNHLLDAVRYAFDGLRQEDEWEDLPDDTGWVAQI